MSGFNTYFTSYEAMDPPPIITEDYKLVEDNYAQYLQQKPLQVLNNVQDIQFKGFPSENPLAIKTEEPIAFIPIKEESPAQDFIRLSSNVPTTQKPKQITSFKDKKDYAKTMYQYLHKALEDNGISGDTWAPILTAQTAFESGWGNKFSRENNNFAGIKGKGSGLVTTKEWSPSRGYYTIKSSFKSYPSIQDFADDYVKKLKNKFNAFNGTPSDYLRNIRNKGYFTASLSDYSRSFNSILKTINTLLNS